MAEMNDAGSRRRGATGKSKRFTRVDLTPMVDLGFLLITFFIFTTTMAQPRSLELNMPYAPPGEPVPPTEVKESTVLTLIPAAGHQVYYYTGMPYIEGKAVKLQQAGFGKQNHIRDAILRQKEKVAAQVRSGTLKSGDKITVLIKPDSASTYDDFVRILDEMNINGIEVYAVIALSPADRSLLQEQIH